MTLIVTGKTLTTSELEIKFKKMQMDAIDLQRKIKFGTPNEQILAKKKLLKNAESMKNIKIILADREQERIAKELADKEKQDKLDKEMAEWQAKLSLTAEEKRQKLKEALENKPERKSVSEYFRNICLKAESYDDMLIVAKKALIYGQTSSSKHDLIRQLKTPQEIIQECGIFVNIQYNLANKENQKRITTKTEFPKSKIKLIDIEIVAERKALFDKIFAENNWEYSKHNKYCITYIIGNTSFTHAVGGNLFMK